MKKMSFCLGGFIILLLLSCCPAKQGDSNLLEGSGTIVHLGFEGGFYGIISDDGNKYDPLNLSDEFKQDSLRVKYKAKPRTDVASMRMWGTIVELIEIEKLK